MTVSTIGAVNKDIKRKINFADNHFYILRLLDVLPKFFFDHEGNDARLLLIVAS